MEGFRFLYSATLDDLKIDTENKRLNDVTLISSILIMIISYWHFMFYFLTTKSEFIKTKTDHYSHLHSTCLWWVNTYPVHWNWLRHHVIYLFPKQQLDSDNCG